MSKADEARARARRWLIGAVAVAALNVAMYFYWRPGWDFFRLWFLNGMWLCVAEWISHRAYARGWEASRRTE